MFHIHGQKLVLELHEYMLGLLWWWLLGHAHKHIIMVSPEIDILKIESTIIQRRFECREAFLLFFLISSLTGVIISSHSPLSHILNQHSLRW